MTYPGDPSSGQYPPPYPGQPGQPYPGQPPQQFVVHHVQPSAANGMGTAGFVLGLLGLIFSWIPFIGIIAWLLVLPGLVLSGVGLAKANRGEANNKGMAIAGLVLSVLGLLFCIGYVVFFASLGAAADAAGY